MALSRAPLGGQARTRASRPSSAAACVSKAVRPTRKLQGATAQAQSSAVDATNPLNSTEGEGYDVYIAESPKKLEEGVEKHIISVFVADESGLINRVAGVFGRRGVNIESLAVGLTADKALFTIVTLGSRSTMSTLVKNLSKLVKVRHVEDITFDNRLDRELALFKMRASHGAARTEILELMKIFDGKVVDVGPDTLTIAMSGDPGKLYAFEQGMRRFDLVELARTGRIALRKSDDQLDLGTTGWAPGMARQLGDMQRLGGKAPASTLQSTDEADVYMVDKRNQAGVWNVRNILDPVSTAAAADVDFVPYTLSIEVGDYPGVLNEVTGVLARRGYNVQSLAVGTSEAKGRSRITTVIPGQERSVMNLMQQLQKMVVVHKVTNLSAVPHVARELMLVKVRCTPGQRSEIKDIAEIFGGTVSHMTRQTITLELVGSQDTMITVQDVLEPYGVLEVARTGRVALTRESQVDSKLIQKSGLGSFV